MKKLLTIAILFASTMLISSSNAKTKSTDNVDNNEVKREWLYCDKEFGGYYDIYVQCNTGSVYVRAYLDGAEVNRQWIYAGNSYIFFRDNSSQKLTLKVCYMSGSYDWWAY